MKSRVGVIISACLFAGFAYAQQDNYEAFKRELPLWNLTTRCLAIIWCMIRRNTSCAIPLILALLWDGPCLI